MRNPLAAPLDDAEIAAAASVLRVSFVMAKQQEGKHSRTRGYVVNAIVIIVPLIWAARAAWYLLVISEGIAIGQIFPSTRWMHPLPGRWRHTYLVAAVLIGVAAVALIAKSR